MNVSEVSSSLFPRREFLRVGSASLVASIVGCAQTPKENLVPRERLEKQISEMRMNFNGQERNVPRDVKIEGPNKDGNFTLESNHLRRVTPSKIEFNER